LALQELGNMIFAGVLEMPNHFPFSTLGITITDALA
jgi:hypothetical protein